MQAPAVEQGITPELEDQQAALDKAVAETDKIKAIEGIQKILDPLCLAGVNINPESRVKAAPGRARACWRSTS